MAGLPVKGPTLISLVTSPIEINLSCVGVDDDTIENDTNINTNTDSSLFIKVFKVISLLVDYHNLFIKLIK